MQTPIQANKTVIITGGNSGLGYYGAQAIAQSGQDWHIIIASRNLSTVEEAVRKLIAETNYSSIEGMVLDLASLASVRQFVQNFKTQEHPPLKAIVCNAGVQIVSGTRYTEDGFEMTFGVNHLGHFLLVNLLLPLSDRSRIVFVSSDTHDPEINTVMPHPQYQDAKALAFPTGNDNHIDMGTVGRMRYTTSKLCNLFCTYELSRRLQKQPSNITVNAFNPGLMINTKLSRDYSESERSALKATLSQHILEQARDPQAMGSALARLILDPALDQVTGQYFDGLKEIRSSNESYDERKAAELWEGSAELVKLAPTE